MNFNGGNAPDIGRAIYKEKILPTLGPEHKGKVVVIDVKSGDYEIADRHMTASGSCGSDVRTPSPGRNGSGIRRCTTWVRGIGPAASAVIRGRVAENVDGELEPCLTVSVEYASGGLLRCDVIVDTGFTGWLTLPEPAIRGAWVWSKSAAYLPRWPAVKWSISPTMKPA